jgi:hypothetical protein
MAVDSVADLVRCALLLREAGLLATSEADQISR